MRRFLMTLGVSMLLMTSVCAKGITLNINDQVVTTPQAPIQDAGTTLVPLRVISDNLDALTDWDAATRTVTITKGSKEIKVKIGDKTVSVNGIKTKVSLAPRNLKGTTMVPLRFISENLDTIVNWDSASQTITIKRDGKERYTTTIDFDEGTYQGEVIVVGDEEVPEGQGKIVYDDGDVYVGGLQDGYFHGVGKFKTAEGVTLEGDFKEGELHGHGKLTLPSEYYVEGEFKNSMVNGYAKSVFTNGDVYTGQFSNDRYHGQGKYVFKSGRVDEGEFQVGVFMGR